MVLDTESLEQIFEKGFRKLANLNCWKINWENVVKIKERQHKEKKSHYIFQTFILIGNNFAGVHHPQP